MKTKLLLTSLVISLILGIGCSKDNEDGNNPDKPNKPSPLPDLPDPDDVCSCMEDLTFMQYCYDKFDVNKDGKVSKIEAAAVVEIDLERRDVRKLTGIGYFTNLESLNCSDCSQLISVDLINNSKITSIGDRAFADCTSLINIIIPESVTSIGEWAFGYCTSLINIIIPESVTSIGEWAFADCTSLINLIIPESVTSIGREAFRCCSSLTDIVIPKSVTSIEEKTFYDCSSLTDIVIPDGVTEIGYEAFSGCSSLTSIYCKPITPPSIIYGVIGVYGFVLYVPAKSIDAYRNSRWSNYYSSIEAIK